MKTARTLVEFAKELIVRIKRAEGFQGWFEEATLELFGLQYRSNAAYRKLCEGAKVSPETIEDWREIPAAPTVGFKELELTSIPVKERTAVFHSSGTTEQRPSRHFHNAESLALYETSLLAGFKAHFREQGGIPLLTSGATSELRTATLLSLTLPTAQAPNSSLVHMFDVLLKVFGSEGSKFLGRVGADGAWSLDANEVADALQGASAAGRPIGLLGTAFLFVDLIDHVRVRLPEGSWVLETGGYKGRSRAVSKRELYSRISECLGVPESAIVSEYGMCELSSQAYAIQGVYRFPPWARVLIISPETGRPVGEGEIGLVRVIDLANVRSAQAIQTEDLGVRRGDGFELVGRTASSEARGCSLMSA